MAELTRLPGPNADLWDWQMQAACRDVGDEDFFHSENERGARKRERDARAKAVCGTCPVVDACREHALKVREPYGVWGGLSVEERHVVLAARRRAALPAAS